MNKNIGVTDKFIRTMLALGLVALYTSGTITDQWKIAIIVMVAVLLLTTIIGICPLYKLLGINTCRKSV